MKLINRASKWRQAETNSFICLDFNTSHIIKRTGKMIKIDRNNAFSGLKFDTEGAKI